MISYSVSSSISYSISNLVSYSISYSISNLVSYSISYSISSLNASLTLSDLDQQTQYIDLDEINLK